MKRRAESTPNLKNFHKSQSPGKQMDRPCRTRRSKTDFFLLNIP